MKKLKFKHETKKGQIVYKINLNIVSDSGYSLCNDYKEGLFITELKIVHQTKYKIALSDEWITCLDRKKEDERSESYKHFLDDVSISIKTKETYFANGVFCQCYTIEDPEKMIKTMKHKIINKINKEYGFIRNLDLESKIYNMEINS